MMTYTFGAGRSAATPAQFHAAMQEGFGHSWDVSPGASERVDTPAVIKAVRFGDMKLSLASLPGAEVSNVARPSSQTPEHPYNIYVSNRRHRVVTNDRSVILEPGDVTVADSAIAATMTTNEPYTTVGLTVPARVLRVYLPDPDRAVGVRFPGKSGLSKIVSHLLLTMWEYAQGDRFDKIGTELAHHLLGLLSACCQAHGECPEPHGTSTVAKREAIKRVIRENLRKPDLCVTEIARQCGLSVRYVQRLFSEEEHTASEYIRRQRLEGCKQQLADPAWLHHSITEIAFNWGFNSSAHFARVFKAECGISAREFRSQALLARTLGSTGVYGQEQLSPPVKTP